MNKKFVPGKSVNIIKETGEVVGYFKNKILVDCHESIKLINPLNHLAISDCIPILQLHKPLDLRIVEENE